MHQRFERCVAALVLEPEGAILAGWALTEDRCRDIDAVLDLALGSAIDAPPGSGVLLISAVGDDPVYADEDTLRRYVGCCDKVEAVGLTLRDWVLANGEAMHSLRVTMSPHLTEPPELTRGPGWP